MDSGKLALLVAGYTADDTLRAANVLNEYEDYAEELAGRTEVEVTGTTMADIAVGLPTIDEPVEEDDEEVVDDEE